MFAKEICKETGYPKKNITMTITFLEIINFYWHKKNIEFYWIKKNIEFYWTILKTHQMEIKIRQQADSNPSQGPKLYNESSLNQK